MQGRLITPSYKISLISVVILLLGLTSGDVAHGRKKLVSSSYGEPCHKMTVYYNDILYDGTNTANATSAVAAQPTLLSRLVSVNDSYFGEVAVFNDVLTAGHAPAAEPVARAEGFNFYDKEESPSAWFAFSLVFSSTEHRGMLNLMGADPIGEKTRDISIVGGTGDFFMARGIATLRTDTFEATSFVDSRNHKSITNSSSATINTSSLCPKAAAGAKDPVTPCNH